MTADPAAIHATIAAYYIDKLAAHGEAPGSRLEECGLPGPGPRTDPPVDRGGSARILSAHSDPEYRREDLFYADPAAMIDHVARRFGRHLALVQDYGLYEFTLMVRPAESARRSYPANGTRPAASPS